MNLPKPSDTDLLAGVERLRRAGRASEALELCRTQLPKLGVGEQAAKGRAIAGMLASELGADEESVLHYVEALRLDPTSAGAHYNLGNALFRQGEAARAIASFRHAISLQPYLAPAHKNLSRALFLLGDHAQALEACRRALVLGPQTAELHRNLGTMLKETGDLEGAQKSFRDALALKPGWTKALQSLTNVLMELGEFRAAHEACEIWLRQRPTDTEALGLQSIALQELGEVEAAARCLDLDGLVRVFQLGEPPAGYLTLSEFNAALSERALRHPSLAVPAEGDPRYHCDNLRITEEFSALKRGPEAALRVLVQQTLVEYMRTLSISHAEHPFVVNAPKRVKLDSWAAVLESGGSLLPHVHYRSHSSAVYYAKVPREIRADDTSRAGWFEFGGTPARYPRSTQAETRAIEPREGMLIVFPSYFYHRTIPFSATEPRISIAFDISGAD